MSRITRFIAAVGPTALFSSGADSATPAGGSSVISGLIGWD